MGIGDGHRLPFSSLSSLLCPDGILRTVMNRKWSGKGKVWSRRVYSISFFSHFQARRRNFNRVSLSVRKFAFVRPCFLFRACWVFFYASTAKLPADRSDRLDGLSVWLVFPSVWTACPPIWSVCSTVLSVSVRPSGGSVVLLIRLSVRLSVTRAFN